MIGSFQYACPSCKTNLISLNSDELSCPADGALFTRDQGIWRFLTPQRRLEFWQFIQDYETIRMAEGRGSSDPNYYRELPFHDLSGRYSSDWKIRSRSYRTLLRSVIVPFEKKAKRPLKILDLGAGNCWLSYQMAKRGHLCAAVDLQTNSLDGLGAHIRYDADFVPIQADFHHLPLSENQVDLVIFNASFHYSTSYLNCLKEAVRVLASRGQIVILDTPIYHNSDSGEAMVLEREEYFRKSFGFASNAILSENYLTFTRLEELSDRIGIHWKLLSAYYNLRWMLRPLKARIFGRREPAQFRIAVGSQPLK
jgi:ubiquinone/menaquinone biosynthesis C-methylase UbiE